MSVDELHDYVEVVRQALTVASAAVVDSLEKLAPEIIMLDVEDRSGTGLTFSVVISHDGSAVLQLPGSVRYDLALGSSDAKEALELLAALVNGEVTYPSSPSGRVVIRDSAGRELARLHVPGRKRVPGVPWGRTFGPYGTGPNRQGDTRG